MPSPFLKSGQIDGQSNVEPLEFGDMHRQVRSKLREAMATADSVSPIISEFEQKISEMIGLIDQRVAKEKQALMEIEQQIKDLDSAKSALGVALDRLHRPAPSVARPNNGLDRLLNAELS